MEFYDILLVSITLTSPKATWISGVLNKMNLTSLWVNWSDIEFECTNKTTALYQSQGVNVQNHVRLFRFSYWLLYNFSVKFAYLKFTDTCYDEGHCERSILKNGNPSHSIFVQGNPSNSHTHQFVQKRTTRIETKSVFSFLKVYKHFTPLLRHIMSTLWIPQMPTANWDAGKTACRVPIDSTQDTSWVCDYSSVFLCDMPGGKIVFEAEGNRISSGINGPALSPS